MATTARPRFSKFAFPAIALIIGCSGGGSGGGGGVPDDIAVGITTGGGARTVASGGTLTIKAQVNNAANVEVTWTLAGSSCPSSCGTLTPTATGFATYTAPSNVLSQFTVTVTATSVQNPAKSDSVTLTIEARICPARSELLAGSYVFLLQGFEINGGNGSAAVGAFTADGCGNVVGGEADYYFGPAVAGHTSSLTGTYSVGPDRRGVVHLTVGSLARTFALALGKVGAGVATRGALTETDTPATTILSGSLWRQDPTVFTSSKISGSYAYVFNGWNGAGPREAMGGVVSANGAGAFLEGVLDGKVFGSAPVIGRDWTGSYGSPSSTGRSVVTSAALTGGAGSAVIYVVDSSLLVAMISDPTAPGRVLSGPMIAQTGTFDLQSLAGTCVTYQTANYDQYGYARMTFAVLSLFVADGSGNLTSTATDVAAGGNYVTVPSVAYRYTVDARGRATIYTSATTDGGRWYLTAPNTALMLGFDTGVSVGAILPQAAGPFTAGSINGSYFGTQAPGPSLYSAHASGVATSTGNGALNATMNVNEAGAVTDQTWTGTLTMASNGRATGWNDSVIYVVSPSTFLVLDDRTTFYPVIRVFEQ